MPHSFPNNGNAAEFVGQTPWSARDALVPRPEQRYQHPAKREQADGGVGRSPGGLPHDQCRCVVVRKLCGIRLAGLRPAPTGQEACPTAFRRAILAAAAMACCILPAAGQRAMDVRQTRYEVRAGEAVQIVAPQETLDFLANAKSRQVEILTGDTAVAGGGLVAAPNRAADQILLGASLRTKPGEYTVRLSATSAAGEQRQTTLAVEVQPRVSVPSSATRPPVVLLNGWETGFTNTCPIAASASDTFGNLAQYLVTDGVPVVYLFDNCLEGAGQSIEVLGNDLATFLKTIKYDTGAQVPQIDLVGFSMGGLIARAYLAGLQPGETLTQIGRASCRERV